MSCEAAAAVRLAGEAGGALGPRRSATKAASPWERQRKPMEKAAPALGRMPEGGGASIGRKKMPAGRRRSRGGIESDASARDDAFGTPALPGGHPFWGLLPVKRLHAADRHARDVASAPLPTRRRAVPLSPIPGHVEDAHPGARASRPHHDWHSVGYRRCLDRPGKGTGNRSVLMNMDAQDEQEQQDEMSCEAAAAVRLAGEAGGALGPRRSATKAASPWERQRKPMEKAAPALGRMPEGGGASIGRKKMPAGRRRSRGGIPFGASCR